MNKRVLEQAWLSVFGAVWARNEDSVDLDRRTQAAVEVADSVVCSLARLSANEDLDRSKIQEEEAWEVLRRLTMNCRSGSDLEAILALAHYIRARG